MRPKFCVALTSAVCLFGWIGYSSGQAPFVQPRSVRSPYSTPTLSPLLNMLRPGAPAALNYAGLYVPQVEAEAAIQQLQQRVTTDEDAIVAAGGEYATGLPPTGHRAAFMTHSFHFMTHLRGGGRMGGGSGGRAGGGGNTSAGRRPSGGSSRGR